MCPYNVYPRYTTSGGKTSLHKWINSACKQSVDPSFSFAISPAAALLFLFVCWEKRQPVSQLNVISQRCVTVATWAGRGGALMQCAVSSAQPRVAARPPIRLRQQSPVYARTWRLTSSGGGLVDFLCTLPLLSGFISPPQRLHILRLCLQTRLSLLEDVGINLNRAPRVWLVPLFVFSLGLSQGKYAKRKSRFKRSDGSTSSDTTSNSFVRQVNVSHFNPPLPRNLLIQVPDSLSTFHTVLFDEAS